MFYRNFCPYCFQINFHYIPKCKRKKVFFQKLKKYFEKNNRLKKLSLFENENRFAKLKLLLFGSTDRAGTCASAAVNTFVSVDYILAILFSDRGNGATVSASAATETCVSIDNVRHSRSPFLGSICFILGCVFSCRQHITPLFYHIS